MYLAEELLFWDTAGPCRLRSPIINPPCPVSPSISEARINRKHSVVLTVEEGLCKHLSGYSAPLCHQCLGLLRNRWTSQEIGPKWHPFPTTLIRLFVMTYSDTSASTSIHKHTLSSFKYRTLAESDPDIAKKSEEFTQSAIKVYLVSFSFLHFNLGNRHNVLYQLINSNDM